MKIYKVTVTKTVFVEADTMEEAKSLALDDDYLMCDECVESIKVSSKNAMRRMMLS